MAYPNGVLIATDGTYTDLAVTEDQRHPIIIAAVGEPFTFRYYGTGVDGTVCAITGPAGQEPNPLATAFAGAIRRRALPTPLTGPVIYLGFHPQAVQLMDLSAAHRALLASLAEPGEAA